MLSTLFIKSSLISGITLLSVVLPPFVSAATWPAVDAQEVNVTAAIANASDGDTVTVPPGVATWSTQLTITKHITLQGAGVGQTIIYDNAPKGGGDQHLILVKLSGDNPPFRLSGFEFEIPANYTVKAQPYGVGILEFQGGGGTVVPGMSANVRVDHCKIRVAGVAMTFRNVLGVVDHVEWIDTGLTNPTTASYWGGWQAASVYMANWGGRNWGHGSWADPPYWGTDKFLFFEDCSFSGVRRNNILFPIDAYEGARYVARYSTFKDAKVGGTGTEGQGRGRKQVECYNNTFISSELIGDAQSCTSGTILVHDNLETNYRNGITVTLQAYRQFEGKLWGQSTGRSPWDENDDFPQAYESGTCTAISSLGMARDLHTATLLPNGMVLVVGGYDGTNSLASAELYDPIAGTWTKTGSLGIARKGHTATVLPNGTVLVVGGNDGTTSLASAELYDPATGTWSATGSVGIGRYYHIATLLANGKVLVAGGNDGSTSLASAELYDPATGTWTTTGNLGTGRYSHSATLLPNGTVLVVGGYDGTNSLASAELYDPSAGTWTTTGNLGTGRYSHSATLLANGTVLVAGGTDGTNSLGSAQLYDPTAGTWSATGSCTTRRAYHASTLLPDGTVLAAGGYDGTNFLTSVELYDPASGTWSATGSIGSARGYHTLTSLLNGKVLVAGGYNGTSLLASTPLYDPAVGTWGAGNNVTDITKNWVPDQWLGDGVSFIIINLSSPVDKIGEHAQTYLIGNSSNSLKQGKAPIPFRVGDQYEIWKVKTTLDQPGQGSGILLTGLPPNASPVTWPQRGYTREPCYSWNNIDPTIGRQMDITAQEPSMKLGRDYFNRTPKPGYMPFVYPHPLVSGISSTPTPTPTPTATPTPTPTPTPANRTPVVNAGPDQIVATHSTGLNGSATDDALPNPPGALTYAWSKVTGPGSVTFGNAQTPNTTATFSAGGTYTLKLSASDSALTGTDTVMLTVNKAPVVNAGPDQTITLPDSATLSGSATDDGIPSQLGALTYTWSKVSGPGTVTFGNVHAASTTTSFSASGTYSLKLTVSDSVFTGTDTVLVTVNPSTSPTADLKVTVSDGKSTIVAGSQSTYTITVTNAGPVAVTGASVIDTFPSIFTGVTFTATQSGGATGFAASGTVNINNTVDMPSGSKITYSAKGKLSAGATGNLSNTAQVTAPSGVLDPSTANNSATDSDSITSQADLKVTITDGKTAAVAGTKNTYTIVVTNAGSSDVAGAVIGDTFPTIFTGVTFTATQTGGATGFTAAGSGVITDTVTMPANSKITYKATGTISASATGSISDTVTVTSPNNVPDPNTANNTATDTDSL